MDACFIRIPISKDDDVFETRQARTQTVMRFSLFFSNHAKANSRGKFNVRIHNQSSRSKSFYPLTNFMNDDKCYVYIQIHTMQFIMMINVKYNQNWLILLRIVI